VAVKKTPDDYDSPWKEAIRMFFPDFLRFFFPQIHQDIDWHQPHDFLDQELHKILGDSAQGKMRVDALVKVFTKLHLEQWLLIHIEIQSQVDSKLPQRMFTYNHRARANSKCPVASLAILADTSPNWRPSLFSEQLWGCEIMFKFLTRKLLDFPTTPEMPDNPFSWLVAAHLHTKRTKRHPQQRITVKLSLLKNLIRCGQSPEMVIQLLRLVDWLLKLPEELEYIFDQEISKFEEEHNMPYVTRWEKRGQEKANRESALTLLKAKVDPDIIFAATGLRPEDLNPTVDSAQPAPKK
jgi:hypothetical protein